MCITPQLQNESPHQPDVIGTAILSTLQMGTWLEKFSHFSNKIRTQTWQPLQSSHSATTASKIWDTGILHIGDLLYLLLHQAESCFHMHCYLQQNIYFICTASTELYKHMIFRI